MFHTKNEMIETAKQIIPKVSSLGQGAKWVSPRGNVSG